MFRFTQQRPPQQQVIQVNLRLCELEKDGETQEVWIDPRINPGQQVRFNNEMWNVVRVINRIIKR